MPREEANDASLIALAAAGDRSAAGAVVARHGAAVARFLRSVLPEGEAHEDAFQETFTAAFRSGERFSEVRGSLRTWLLAIARNTARSSRRASQRMTSTDPNLLDLGIAAGWGQHDPEREVSEKERRALLSQALGALDPEDRELLLLRDVEGLSGQETADLLGVSLAAMKSRLHRARLRMMAAYREQSRGVHAQQRTVGGLSCGEVLQVLSSYVDGELNDEGRAQVDAHLKGCSVCERFGGRFSLLVHDARAALGVETAIDGDAVQAMLDRLS